MKNNLKILGTFTALFLVGFLLLAALPSVPSQPGPARDSALSSLAAATSLSGTDIIYVVVSGNSRKLAWSDLMAQIRDTLEARNFVTTGDWQFVGAYFNAGANGRVTFADSVVFSSFVHLNGITYSHNLYPATTDLYSLGNTLGRWDKIKGRLVYADQYIITNPSAPSTDTLIISYDGEKMNFNSNIAFTDSGVYNIGAGLLPIDSLFINYIGGLYGSSVDSVALSGGSAGYAVTARVMVFDGNPTPSTVDIERPVFEGQELFIIDAGSDGHGFDLLDVDGRTELIGDANKTFSANDVMHLVGYNGVWHQVAAIAAN